MRKLSLGLVVLFLSFAPAWGVWQQATVCNGTGAFSTETGVCWAQAPDICNGTPSNAGNLAANDWVTQGVGVDELSNPTRVNAYLVTTNGTFWGGADYVAGYGHLYTIVVGNNFDSNRVYCSRIKVVNTDSFLRWYNILTNGNVAVPMVPLAAGGTLDYSLCFTNVFVGLSVERFTPLSDAIDMTYEGSCTTNFGSFPGIPNPPFQGTNGGTAGPGYYAGYVTNIVWGVGGASNVQVGFSAVFDGVSKSAAQAHLDAIMLSNTIATHGGGSGSTTVTNNITITNSTDLTGISNLLAHANEVADGVSNVLAQGFSGLSTNKPTIQGMWTNGQAAFTAGQGEAESMFAANAGFQGMLSDTLTIGSGIVDPGGTEDYEIHLGLTGVPNFHIAPLGVDSLFAKLSVMLTKLFTFILYLGYAYWIVKTMADSWKQILNYRGTQIQDLEIDVAGFGGNALGVTVAAFVNVALLVAYAAGLGLVVTICVGGNRWAELIATLAGNPFGTASGDVSSGVHWVLSCFPFALAVGLVAARMWFKMTMMVSLSMMRYCIRYLPGV